MPKRRLRKQSGGPPCKITQLAERNSLSYHLPTIPCDVSALLGAAALFADERS